MEMISAIPKIPEDILRANPSALHQEGMELKKYLREARERVAKVLEVMPEEVIFTSGATESDNLAIKGTVETWLKEGIKAEEIFIFYSEIEHVAIIEAISTTNVNHVELKTEGGIINHKDITIPQNAKAVLISVMYVNNEIGTVQDISEISKRVRYLRKHNPDVKIVFHTDATQAPAHFSLRVPSLGVDMMTLGSTKLYCDKGVGVLFKKRNIKTTPIMHGGGQEYGLRAGTEPVRLIHEFSFALKYAHEIRDKETLRVKELQNYFETEIKSRFPNIKISAENSPRTPHISHIAIPNFDSELMVLELDARGISVSAKSACKNEEGNESPVVEQLHGKGFAGVRFSFGRKTAKKDIDIALQALASVIEKYRG